MIRAFTFALIGWFVVDAARAEVTLPVKGAGRTYPPDLPGALVEPYKEIDGAKLNLYIFKPDDWQASDRRPAIVFFFGGGWQSGSPTQFYYQSLYLTSRGLVAIAADYRVASRHKAKVIDCVRDAKSAIRWVREHAGQLGIDPERIAAGGGSAGGHIAACTGAIDGLDEEGESTAISSRPNAMVLFNPVVLMGPADDPTIEGLKMRPEFVERLGTDATKISPYHHVRAGIPPTLIMIGTADNLLAGNKAFAEKMAAAGNRCDLETWVDMPHSFFNINKYDSKPFLETLTATDKFLASLGYLTGPPTVDKFFIVSKSEAKN
ncbi:MAG TPA: alpha/beta hydrolase [Pirellulales bacterium]|jgi:acetyl esterase/lipase|nr:alpha/beta hydrolase [Pirellulales bacterium]